MLPVLPVYDRCGGEAYRSLIGYGSLNRALSGRRAGAKDGSFAPELGAGADGAVGIAEVDAGVERGGGGAVEEEGPCGGSYRRGGSSRTREEDV